MIEFLKACKLLGALIIESKQITRFFPWGHARTIAHENCGNFFGRDLLLEPTKIVENFLVAICYNVAKLQSVASRKVISRWFRDLQARIWWRLV